MMLARPALARGFTMIELLVVLAILGVLAGAIMPLGETLLAAQKERELREALWTVRAALDDYKRATERGSIARTTESGYPPRLEALVDGVDDARAEHAGSKLYFLRQLPRDPMADPLAHPLPPAAATWRLRSYASPPNAPAPGADVFDIRSSSDALGLDGTPHAGW